MIVIPPVSGDVSLFIADRGPSSPLSVLNNCMDRFPDVSVSLTHPGICPYRIEKLPIHSKPCFCYAVIIHTDAGNFWDGNGRWFLRLFSYCLFGPPSHRNGIPYKSLCSEGSATLTGSRLGGFKIRFGWRTLPTGKHTADAFRPSSCSP